jgi:hypothetical protein
MEVWTREAEEALRKAIALAGDKRPDYTRKQTVNGRSQKQG